MNAYRGEKPAGFSKLTPAEQAANAAYTLPDKTLYVPGYNLQRALISGASYSKGKGKASLQKLVAAAVFIPETEISLGTKKYTIAQHRVVLRATGGAHIAYRPRIDKWELHFTIEYDEILLSHKEIKKVLEDTGRLVGILDFRPERKGPYGRFEVVSMS